MEDMGMSTLQRKFYAGKSVFLTGHTGFKGSWLTMWLADCGARVHGYSLPPGTVPSLFIEADVAGLLASHTEGDVRDLPVLRKAMQSARPEIVFHFAAQPLVRRSYREPVDTFATNVMGTVHVMEAVRSCSSAKVCQIITTDKCYENEGATHPYRETDRLGGHDPYSASKACAELTVASYRRSFMADAGLSLASARAGNVIGGGDWAEDRIIPDCIRALSAGKPVAIRNPGAIRPWQHLLEPLDGYLALAMHQFHNPAAFAQAFNFGPSTDSQVTVLDVVQQVIAVWGQGAYEIPDDALHSRARLQEAALLQLDITKARETLGWAPRWSVGQAIEATVQWYRQRLEPCFSARDACLKQIHQYEYSRCATNREEEHAARR